MKGSKILFWKSKRRRYPNDLFDNLTSLVPDGRVYNASSVNGIFRYLEMQKCNIVPILVHQLNCPDNAPRRQLCVERVSSLSVLIRRSSLPHLKQGENSLLVRFLML